MPAVSVIIPTHNRLSSLPRAIASVLAQTFADFELLIVDDGSSDGTAAWLQTQSDPRIRVLALPKRMGVSFARNRGVEMAQAPWVAFLDSDDEWLPEKLAMQTKAVCADPHLRWHHGEEIWVRNGVRVNPMRKHEKSGGDIFLRAVKMCCVSPSAVMIRRDFFLAMGGFREDFEVCEDYDLWLKMSARAEIGWIPEPLLIKYGGHEDQLSRRYRAMDLWRVVALESCLNQSPLTPERAQAVRAELQSKLKVLLKGCRRHQNLASYDALFYRKRRYQPAADRTSVIGE